MEKLPRFILLLLFGTGGGCLGIVLMLLLLAAIFQLVMWCIGSSATTYWVFHIIGIILVPVTGAVAFGVGVGIAQRWFGPHPGKQQEPPGGKGSSHQE